MLNTGISHQSISLSSESYGVPTETLPNGAPATLHGGAVAASIHAKSEATPLVLPLDAREQLFNGGAVGPIDHIQVSTERIARLNGILFDIDPTNLSEGPLLPGLSSDPQKFYEQCVQGWLARHPLLQRLEVRASGSGLHAILWLDPPVEFTDDGERKRWCSIVKIV